MGGLTGAMPSRSSRPAVFDTSLSRRPFLSLRVVLNIWCIGSMRDVFFADRCGFRRLTGQRPNIKFMRDSSESAGFW